MNTVRDEPRAFVPEDIKHIVSDVDSFLEFGKRADLIRLHRIMVEQANLRGRAGAMFADDQREDVIALSKSFACHTNISVEIKLDASILSYNVLISSAADRREKVVVRTIEFPDPNDVPPMSLVREIAWKEVAYREPESPCPFCTGVETQAAPV